MTFQHILPRVNLSANIELPFHVPDEAKAAFIYIHVYAIVSGVPSFLVLLRLKTPFDDVAPGRIFAYPNTVSSVGSRIFVVGGKALDDDVWSVPLDSPITCGLFFGVGGTVDLAISVGFS